jgi:hypothetical protein
MGPGNAEAAQRAEPSVREARRVAADRVALHHDARHPRLRQVVGAGHTCEPAAHDHDVGRNPRHGPEILSKSASAVKLTPPSEGAPWPWAARRTSSPLDILRGLIAQSAEHEPALFRQRASDAGARVRPVTLGVLAEDQHWGAVHRQPRDGIDRARGRGQSPFMTALRVTPSMPLASPLAGPPLRAIAGWRLRPTRIDEIAAPNRAPWPGHLIRENPR